MRGPSKDPEDNSSPRLMDLLSMGIGAAVTVGVGLVAGLLADDWLHTSPALTFVGLALGVIGAVALMVHQVRRSL
jgi:F0F1-type ATP synthase assembly protein I